MYIDGKHGYNSHVLVLDPMHLVTEGDAFDCVEKHIRFCDEYCDINGGEAHRPHMGIIPCMCEHCGGNVWPGQRFDKDESDFESITQDLKMIKWHDKENDENAR